MSRKPTHPSQDLVAACAPYFGAEIEIVRAYFRSPSRDSASDARWLLQQAHKELVDGVVDRLAEMQHAYSLDMLAAGGVAVDLETRTELAHFLAFGEACRTARGRGSAPLATAEVLGAEWAENRALRDLRRQHREQHGALGKHAAAFTEGGWCTLYAAGIELAGGTEVDRAIARACALVYRDECDHVGDAMTRIEAAHLGADETSLLADLVREQCVLRLRMRNAQFGWPIHPHRIAELEAGAGTPYREPLLVEAL